MKKTGLTKRLMALLLVIIMTVQMLPVSSFAFGALSSGDTGIEVDSLNKEDSINWPIKVFDYLNDGMLFEWNDSTHTSKLPDGNDTNANNSAPYGGGEAPPVTELGSDFTYDSRLNASQYYNGTTYSLKYTAWSSSGAYDRNPATNAVYTRYSPYYYRTNSNYYYGLNYYINKMAAVDYTSPMYMRITNNPNTTGTSYWNMNLSYFPTDQSTTSSGTVRYMVLVYRGSGLSDNEFRISASGTTGGSPWLFKWYKIPDSADWTYMIFDLSQLTSNGTVTTSSAIQYTWLTCSNSNHSSGDLDSDDKLDITHVGYFGNLQEAHNYGAAAVKFDKNPGEYLRKTPGTNGSFTATTTTIDYPDRPSLNGSEYILSLHYNWKTAGTAPYIEDTGNVYPSASYPYVFYGMDLTRSDKNNGAYTNAYTTNSYYTWESPSNQNYKYTANGVTTTTAFPMTAIHVAKNMEVNGASYVRLTTDGPSRILLSKFREDHSSGDGNEYRVPLTSNVNYAVLVYRGNGLSAEDQYAFWAQGYTAGTYYDWKYAGLDGNPEKWQSADNVNPQSFNSNTGWQYVVIPLMETISAEDSDMSAVTRLARLGLYLPELSDGKSLDLAYVAYFPNETSANTFGAAAKTYMNSTPTVTPSNTTISNWGTSRVWNPGNNKGFGLLYSTGAGNWDFTTYATEGGSNDTDAYGYDTWMIGYNTAQYSGNAFNTNRKDPMTGKAYEANYTAASTSKTIIQDVEGSTNNIYFLSVYGSSDDGISQEADASDFNTSVLDFDGYELLETVTSGVMTAGLLEGSLRTINVDGTDYRVPVYRQETVEYIAYLLVNALRIPQRDSKGNYNMNFVSGKKSTLFGGVDLNGDGVVGMANLDGDSRNGNECDETSVDLATALRHCLGITLPIGSDAGVWTRGYADTLGTYKATLSKDTQLLGKFSDCRGSITTAMDAAYYMLNSLFVGNSFNQEQDDYYYLNMPSATVNGSNGHSGMAYIFDAAFTSGSTGTSSATNAVTYSPAVDANNQVGTGTIYLNNVTGKTLFDYGTSSTSWTSRFPFLPVTDAEGDFAGGTYSYSFWDDSQRNNHTSAGSSDSLYTPNATSGDYTVNRSNYNYAIVSNGQFVYNEEDALFFDFEGDDDVYLFINGELVLDIGAGHSITSVFIDVNDYVTAARAALAPLAEYGYTAEMTDEEFDEMIDSDTLNKYTYDSTTGKITGTTPVTNTYTEEARANFKRWARLDLVDGEICEFDFYYMERHSWGANMRIVTNMHITDPALDVDKTAYQFGQEIEYGGVIDPTSSLEYNFALTNSGNSKLYNLTFQDDVIGVKLDPENGLTVSMYNETVSRNGKYVLDSTGGTLEPKDLSAVVKGYNAVGQYVEVAVTFPEIKDAEGNSDEGATALKNFLHTLEAEGTEEGQDDAEVTRAGSGLWVDATVIIKGIYYTLTPEQTKEGAVHNTVYLTATTKRYSTTIGNKTLYSDAEHLIYTSGFPVHYQWAGHNIFVNLNTLLKHAYEESLNQDSQLNQYTNFFKAVNDSGQGANFIYSQLCDKYGRVGGYFPYQRAFTDGEGNPGYLINYDEPGVYTFYLLLYLREDAGNIYDDSGVNAADIESGSYAIIRSQVYVADVEDSVFVLDYGLSTESLDANGELFKNDYLFGSYGTVRAKLMGVTGQAPTYLDPERVTSGTDYSRITFKSQVLTTDNTIKKLDENGNDIGDGIFKVNLAIPDTGKLITYDSTTGKYSLTGVGTVKVTAVVPSGWNNVHLYYWYDDGTTGPAWPGTLMTEDQGDKYVLDIPADVSKVIINNGAAAEQTVDLSITPGMPSTITVSTETVQSGNIYKHLADVATIIEDVTYHVKNSAEWSDVKVHYLSGGEWSVAEKTGSTVDTNGYYTFQIPGDVTSVYVSDGGTNRTAEQVVYAGKEVWLETSQAADSTGYNLSIRYTLAADYIVHASVPSSWKDTVYVYYWYEGQEGKIAWPGVPMTKGDFGWYTCEDIPADMTHLIINDGNTGNNHQTVDLTVTPGLETWVMVENKVGADGKYTATVAYGSESGSAGLTFTPKNFMDTIHEMWMAITVHSTSANPTKVDTGINIHNEVQMYKKITVLPATVVYYEDCFEDIVYSKEDASSKNVFIYQGSGSGRLSQSVDQDLPYGQDPTYQDESNSLYSGDSLTKFQILDTKQVAYFTFTGTGFEVIGRTYATDTASVVARVYDPATYAAYVQEYEAYKIEMVPYAAARAEYDAKVAAYNKAWADYDAEYAIYLKDLAAFEADTTGMVEEPFEPNKPTIAEPEAFTMVEPTAPARPTALKIVPVITQFDNGNNGGDEGIDQVPVLRVENLTHGSYTVELSSIPSHTYDENFNVTGTLETYLYIDGVRIYEPMGDDEDAKILYSESERDAQVEELRDLIIGGQVAVGTVESDEGGTKLNLSTGTTTWTESLNDNDFDPNNEETYKNLQVGSTDDYLIQGPNNEVYMEGATVNSALVFYVTKTEGSTTNELQIAVRALDYVKFLGSGSSGLGAQLQYGVLYNGEFAWKNLTTVVSGTEQYYSIPYAECPVDSQGRYQIAVRAVNPDDGTPAMVAYTSVKLNGLTIEKMDGLGESSILYYENGFLVKPQYELIIIKDSSFEPVEIIPFNGNELTLTWDRTNVYMYLRVTIGEKEYIYYAPSDPGPVTSATMLQYGSTAFPESSRRWTLNIAEVNGDITFTINQTAMESLTLSYCVHTYDEGKVTYEANCTYPEVKTFTCTKCGHEKDIAYETNGEHTFQGGSCIYCKQHESAFYLVGYINNTDYEGKDYLFVDGKLVVTFNVSGYVAIKSESGTWFMTDGWLGNDTTSATLYDSNAIDTDDKLYVPGGVELTFTLVVNDDGTVTLSYTHPCIHSWNEGEVTQDATCILDGVKTLTCTLCGETTTESIEAAGHNYVDNNCTVCGQELKRLIYVKAPEEWASVNIWSWDYAENHYSGDNWPGDAMTPVPDEEGWYLYELDMDAAYVIFSNGGGSQTADLMIPSSLINRYDITTGSWEYIDYYLVGYINGANHGAEDDSGNMGNYRFVDGKLVATFTDTSYVMVKTTGNGKWYVTDGWLEPAPTTVTLYDSNTIDTDNKLQVPGGVELTFTLTVNDDGTVTLSYIQACSEHNYEGEQTITPTCITKGEMTYTCSNCGDSYTEELDYVDHNYTTESPDDCTVCGEDRTYKVYFQNDSGLDNIYIWAWDNGNNYTGGNWPGAAMTKENDTGLYSYDLSVKATGLLFNDGNDGVKTADLVAPGDGSENVQYNSLSGSWTALGVSDITEYCLMGWIENANSGTDTDWANTSSHRFSGAYVVTFNSDAYVGVKSVNGTDSVNWYWTDYTENSVCTFYKDGKGDKQKIPAGTYVIRLLNQGNGSSVMMRYDAYTQAAVATVSMSMDLANAAAYSEETAAIELPDTYFVGDEEQVLNLYAVNQQLSSTIVVGEEDTFGEPDNIPDVPENGEELKFSSASLELANDISVIYKITVPAGYSDVYMVFAFNGENTVVTEYTVDDQGRYCFKFPGILPQQMGDNISATVYGTIEGEVVSVSYNEYSVRKYCVSQLNKEISAEFRQLVTDLLVYGEKSQNYAGYKTGELVTDGLTLAPSAFPGLDASADKQELSGERDDNNRIASTALYLKNKVMVRFGVVVEDPEASTVEVTINGRTTVCNVSDLSYENGRYYLHFDGINATEFDDLITVVLKTNGEQVGQTLSYSVNSYIYKKQNTSDEALQVLLHAIYNYGKSAVTYVVSK